MRCGTVDKEALTFWLMLASLAHGAETPTSEVVLSGARWRGLQAPEADEDVAPGPRVVDRSVRLTRGTEEVWIEVRWRLDAHAPGWFVESLVGPGVTVTSLTWRGEPLGVGSSPRGSGHIALWVDLSLIHI